MDIPKRPSTLLRLHGVKLDNDTAMPTVVAYARYQHMTQNGLLIAYMRKDTDWLFVPTEYADAVLDSLDHDGECILLL